MMKLKINSIKKKEKNKHKSTQVSMSNSLSKSWDWDNHVERKFKKKIIKLNSRPMLKGKTENKI